MPARSAQRAAGSRQAGADPKVGPQSDTDTGDTVCPHCGESQDLAKVKGCIKCLTCGFKFDCNGW